jgi:membrane peptidoglycan carboxypeptidase
MWMTGLTPSLALVFWYGSEHGKARLVSQKQDGLDAMAEGYGRLLRALPRDKLLFSSKKNVYYERVKLSDKSEAVRNMPRFKASAPKQTF